VFENFPSSTSTPLVLARNLPYTTSKYDMVKNLPINVKRDIRGDAMIYYFPKSGLKRTQASFLRCILAGNTLPHIRLTFTGGSSLIMNRVLRTRGCTRWLLTDLPLYYTARESAPTFDIAFDNNRVQWVLFLQALVFGPFLVIQCGVQRVDYLLY
jgi:hypothetical protein